VCNYVISIHTPRACDPNIYKSAPLQPLIPHAQSRILCTPLLTTKSSTRTLLSSFESAGNGKSHTRAFVSVVDFLRSNCSRSPSDCRILPPPTAFTSHTKHPGDPKASVQFWGTLRDAESPSDVGEIMDHRRNGNLENRNPMDDSGSDENIGTSAIGQTDTGDVEQDLENGLMDLEQKLHDDSLRKEYLERILGDRPFDQWLQNGGDPDKLLIHDENAHADGMDAAAGLDDDPLLTEIWEFRGAKQGWVQIFVDDDVSDRDASQEMSNEQGGYPYPWVEVGSSGNVVSYSEMEAKESWEGTILEDGGQDERNNDETPIVNT
jgi:hypothetical protein